MQDVAKGHIFTLYREHVAIIEEYADAEWRGNKSEALRRIIESFQRNGKIHTSSSAETTPDQIPQAAVA